jgi:hypothetical protein
MLSKIRMGIIVGSNPSRLSNIRVTSGSLGILFGAGSGTENVRLVRNTDGMYDMTLNEDMGPCLIDGVYEGRLNGDTEY